MRENQKGCLDDHCIEDGATFTFPKVEFIQQEKQISLNDQI